MIHVAKGNAQNNKNQAEIQIIPVHEYGRNCGNDKKRAGRNPCRGMERKTAKKIDPGIEARKKQD
jgi:hypothetical protein